MEPNAEQFVVTLPSNAERGNTPAQFKIRLPHLLKFDDRWEVALYSIIYPRTWPNIIHNTIFFTPPNTTQQIGVAIPTGHYDTPQDVAKAINVAVDTPGFEVRVHSIENRAYISVPQSMVIEFSSRLQETLGIDEPRLFKSTFSTRCINLNTSSVIYVYTDIVESQITGGSHTSLLQVIPAQGKFGEIQHFSPQNLVYLPLRAHNISAISIRLTDTYGDNVQFQSGHVIIQLHFRKIMS